MSEQVVRQTSITGNLIMLCRFLRSKGYLISNTEEKDAINALLLIPPVSEALYQSVLQAVLCKNQFQYSGFDDLYKEYQYEMDKAVDSKKKEMLSPNSSSGKNQRPSIEALKNWLYHLPSSEVRDITTYSNIEVLTRKDFSSMTPDEINFILRVLKKMELRVLRRKSRLHKIAKRRKHINLAMSLRKNLRSGTDINEIVFSERKTKKLKLVLLCDVSKSMDIYSRFFMQMIYAFQTGYDRIETFVFSTALHKISGLLDNHTFEKAYELISERVPQWSGGTKIGACLETFCDLHLHQTVDRKTVVMILSDGWDTGDPEMMQTSIRQIFKFARRLIWLNPLAGHPDFKPEVTGLKSVSTYINKLYPAHNLESLKAVMHQL